MRQRSPSKTSARDADRAALALDREGEPRDGDRVDQLPDGVDRLLAALGHRGGLVGSSRGRRSVPCEGCLPRTDAGSGGTRSTCLASPARATASGASLGSPTGVASRGAEGGGVAGDWTSQTRIGDHTSVRSAVRSFRGGPSFLRRVGASPTRIRCRDSRGERALGGGARGPRGGAAPRRASRRR